MQGNGNKLNKHAQFSIYTHIYPLSQNTFIYLTIMEFGHGLNTSNCPKGMEHGLIQVTILREFGMT